MNNSLLAGISRGSVTKLHRCQNLAARVVSRTRKREHITPVLIQLHCLPVAERIKFKVLLQVYRVLNGMAPTYLSDLIQRYEPGRSLRSKDTNTLHVPRTKHSWGDRAFSKTAPMLWNTLPLNIRTASSLVSFKSKLKTYLFNVVYK